MYCLASNMAASRALTAVLLLVCICSVHRVSIAKARHKRNAADDRAIQSVLQSFIIRINQMKALISKQNNIIRHQKRTIRRLKWTLRRKGTEERLGEIDSDFKHQSIIIEHDAKLPKLTALKNSLDRSALKLDRVNNSITFRTKPIVNELYKRLILTDQRIDCKVFYTGWKKQADHKIGSLSKHFLECPREEFMQGFLLQRKDGGLDSDVRYKFRCCRYNIKDKWNPPPQ